MDQKYTSYNVTYTNDEIGQTVALLEHALDGIDRDLSIVSLVCLALCFSDPEIVKEEERFRNAVESVCDHMVWVIGAPVVKPEEMN